MKILHAQWTIDVYNQLSSFDRQKIILTGWKASGISDYLTKGLAGFSGDSTDPFYHIHPFDQGEIDFNITSVVNCESEEYIERVFAATNDFNNDGGDLGMAIRSDDLREKENDEKIDDN